MPIIHDQCECTICTYAMFGDGRGCIYVLSSMKLNIYIEDSAISIKSYRTTYPHAQSRRDTQQTLNTRASTITLSVREGCVNVQIRECGGGTTVSLRTLGTRVFSDTGLSGHWMENEVKHAPFSIRKPR